MNMSFWPFLFSNPNLCSPNQNSLCTETQWAISVLTGIAGWCYFTHWKISQSIIKIFNLLTQKFNSGHSVPSHSYLSPINTQFRLLFHLSCHEVSPPSESSNSSLSRLSLRSTSNPVLLFTSGAQMTSSSFQMCRIHEWDSVWDRD